MKNKSISVRLKKVSTYETQEKILKDWREGWRKDQLLTIIRLRRAAEEDDHSEIMHMIDQLMGLTEKRFTGLESVLRILSEPDRKLKHSENLSSGDSSDIVETAEVIHSNLMDEETECPDDMISEIVKCYNAQMPIREIADCNNINDHKVIKILVTAGVYTSETYDLIKKLRERGLTDEEISAKYGFSKSTMNDYTPYKKGIYNSDTPSQNAENIRTYRKNKK